MQIICGSGRTTNCYSLPIVEMFGIKGRTASENGIIEKWLNKPT
jgi:hypothetical protein